MHEFGLFFSCVTSEVLGFRCLVVARAGRYFPSHEFLPHVFSLSFLYLEDRAVNSSISIYIFHGQGVVFLMGKETDDSATSERSRSLPDLHRRSADLLALAHPETQPRTEAIFTSAAGFASCSNRNASSLT